MELVISAEKLVTQKVCFFDVAFRKQVGCFRYRDPARTYERQIIYLTENYLRLALKTTFRIHELLSGLFHLETVLNKTLLQVWRVFPARVLRAAALVASKQGIA